MPRLIDTSGTLLNDSWEILGKEATLEDVLAHPASSLVVPLTLWRSARNSLRESNISLAVWLDSDEQASALEADIQDLKMIALNFPGFMDGRSYSTAVILRTHYGYKGEIRAIGDILRDQLFYLRRCGFSTFALKDTVKLEEAVAAFSDFSDSYQTTVEQPLPLFRRRVPA